MSVRYTATWYDVMQARQHHTHLSSHTHTLTQYSSDRQLGQWVRWCERVKMAQQCVDICS